MFSKYFLFAVLLRAKICWSYLVSPFAKQYVTPQSTPLNPEYVGEPLILTPYLQSQQVSYARQLSEVKPFFKGIVSNSGFFTVNETDNSNLFFWFFRKEGDEDWQNAPLILWLQGGPGCSSLYGLFEENGPFTFTKKGLKQRKDSWTKNYNVLYIDQPVGTGFSFTNPSGYISTQKQVADHLYEALTQFFQLYPELKNNYFYIAGESYAGRFIPAIALKIHTKKMAGKSDFNLKGLFMISATIDGISLTKNLTDYCSNVSIIDTRTKNKLKPMETEIESYAHSSLWKNASELEQKILSEISTQSLVSLYDYTKSEMFENLRQYADFSNSSDIRKKIHVGNVSYTACSSKVGQDFTEDQAKTVVPWVEELLEYYSMAFVGGQFDVIVAYPLVVNVLNQLNWSGAAEYSSAKRNFIYNGERLAGYSKIASNLKDILVIAAGHMVPKDQPQVALDLLNRFVNDDL